MALVPVLMNCGNGTRFTDSFGGCNSFASTLVGTDARFRGPKFSIVYRLQLVSAGLTSGSCRVGISPGGGGASPIRQYLGVTVSGSTFHLLPILDTTACGFQIVTDVSKAKDTVEHSIAWTYDQAGSWALYWDGSQVGSGAAPCADISGPATVNDIFHIVGSTDFGGVEVFNIDRVMYANDVMLAAQILDIHNNCAHF